MRSGGQGPARRYARALLDVVETAERDGDGLQADLAEAAKAWEGSPELQRALGHPGLSAERRQQVARAVFQGASPVFAKLLDLLLERGRIALLPEIARVFAALWNERRGVASALAVTAAPLDDRQRTALAKALSEASGKRVELQAAVDPALLGGVVVRMGGLTYDGSVRTRLAALRQTLSGRSPGA